MWQVKYGLGGGFGGCGEWEDTDCKTEEEAVNYAYELACEEYDSYSGTADALEEDPDLTEGELDDMWLEDREDWISYRAREVV